jgi:bacterioferritin
MKIRVITAQTEPSPSPIEETTQKVEQTSEAMNANGKEELVRELLAQYNSEIETAMNYLAISENLKGIRASIINEALAADVDVEMGHAKTIAKRLKVLGVPVPCSLHFKAEQAFFRHDKHSDIIAVIKGVIEAEAGAVARYKKIITIADSLEDWATVDEMSPIMNDEENHRREFLDFLKEFK